MKRLLCFIGIHEKTPFLEYWVQGYHITHACWRCGKTWVAE